MVLGLVQGLSKVPPDHPEGGSGVELYSGGVWGTPNFEPRGPARRPASVTLLRRLLRRLSAEWLYAHGGRLQSSPRGARPPQPPLLPEAGALFHPAGALDGLRRLWSPWGWWTRRTAPVRFKQLEMPIPRYHPADLRGSGELVVYEKAEKV